MSSSFELRDYANLLYVFDASPPYAVRRVSAPFTLPSCVQQKLHMRIQVVKSLVRADGGYSVGEVVEDGFRGLDGAGGDGAV